MDKLVPACEGKRFTVSMTVEVAKSFSKVAAKERARCLEWIRRYADDGHELLDSTKLRNEGKFALGDKAGTHVSVLAFKAWQVRLYGGVVDGSHFVVTEIDAAKKTDKADRPMLERAARKLAQFVKPGK